MNKFEYVPKSLLGDPTRIEVLKNKIHIGNIRINPIGHYQFYKGDNIIQLNPSLVASDLEALKKKIESNY